MNMNVDLTYVVATKDYWLMGNVNPVQLIQENRILCHVCQIYVVHFKRFFLMVNVQTVPNFKEHPKMENNVFKLNVV